MVTATNAIPGVNSPTQIPYTLKFFLLLTVTNRDKTTIEIKYFHLRPHSHSCMPTAHAAAAAAPSPSTPSTASTPSSSSSATRRLRHDLAHCVFGRVIDEQGVQIQAVRQNVMPDVVSADGEKLMVCRVLALNCHLYVLQVRIHGHVHP